MKGLLFSKVYLDQIVDGRKKNDARMHPCKVRGRIALVEKETHLIRATADLTGLEPIPYSEFAKWHSDAVDSEVPISAMPMSVTCYSYILEDLKVLDVPVDAGDFDSHMWIDLPDGLV